MRVNTRYIDATWGTSSLYLLSRKNLRTVAGDELELWVGDGGVFLGTVSGEEKPDDGEDETDAAVEVEDEGPAVVQRDLTQKRWDQERQDAAHTVT